MLYELITPVEVTGDYIPGCAPRPVGDGTWEPGEGGTMLNMKVMLNGHNIAPMLSDDEIERMEEAWLEHYESNP